MKTIKITFSGAGLLAIGIPLNIVGNKNRKKAIFKSESL